MSPATLAAYAADWAGFEAWCRGRGVATLPATPATVAAYLAGIARRHGTPARRAAAIGTAELRRLVASCTDGLTGTRDRALLLLGFAAARQPCGGASWSRCSASI
ncbi:site-specific integrase [Paracraurococcus ruber]|uniref:Phage integrase, N-terminal SAM-like domain n=1 Tax=Paracraurococcus ruber TaxID=77675 RepID=A0ABS1D171_9PROT|nr:hypothetical protein [Paracraurococcus ruber]MBK1660273.1 hypothetical protein [Paracraurococcus ruber]TDG27999.1 hypothetical protein E2C05_21610 [Paracraurococcus ruber]